MTDTTIAMDLAMFGEGGEGAEGAGAPAGSTVDNGREVQSDAPAADRAGEFEKLIKGEYKDEFDARVQSILNRRFKTEKRADRDYDRARPALDMIAERYGLQDPTDTEALARALETNADELGDTPPTDQDNPMPTPEAMVNRVAARLNAQAAEARDFYPGLNLGHEMSKPMFRHLLKCGMDVRSAYEALNHRKIVGDAMAVTAQIISRKVTGGIASRANRPVEGAAKPKSAPTIARKNLDQLTLSDYLDIERRAARGEKIKF